MNQQETISEVKEPYTEYLPTGQAGGRFSYADYLGTPGRKGTCYHNGVLHQEKMNKTQIET